MKGSGSEEERKGLIPIKEAKKQRIALKLTSMMKAVPSLQLLSSHHTAHPQSSAYPSPHEPGLTQVLQQGQETAEREGGILELIPKNTTKNYSSYASSSPPHGISQIFVLVYGDIEGKEREGGKITDERRL